MSIIKDKTVLVTGGAKGIGKLVGEYCLEAGAKRLILWDVDRQALHNTSRELRNRGFKVHFYFVDLSKTLEIDRAAESTLKNVGPVDILLNAAGVVVGKNFQDHSAMDIDKTIHVNLLGLIHTTRVFLPTMIKNGAGHIVNISSAAGMIANPKMSVYVASKWGVLGWSESLRLELEAISKNLHVTTVTPSYVATGMFDGVKAPFLTPILKPKTIAKKIVKAIESNKILVRAPFMVHLLPLLRGILPTRFFDFLAGKIFGVYGSMESFVGHQKKSSQHRFRKPFRRRFNNKRKQQNTSPPSKE